MVSGTGPAPNQADTVAFWRGLWSEPVNHSEGPWTEVVASQCADLHHKDKKKVHDAWVRISNEMEISIPDLKRKKEALMATFRQHLKRKRLQYLLDVVMKTYINPFGERKQNDLFVSKSQTQRYEHPVVEPQTYETIQVLDEQEKLARPANITTQEGLPTPSNKNVLKRRSSNPTELQEATRHMKIALGTINAVLSNKMNQGDDVCDLYGKLLASKLKKYFSDVEQQEVMCELDNVLIKRIRNRQTQSYISSPSTPRSVDSFSPASPL
ncbi:unnamed protein product [Parnassius apollo]|uniref:(apollo) hypothetical protein n=1 Tax=Parnassius apollo TaxID=110799 RepID=A0A8S3XJC6_PARAO|nr:unnamed protein product [Parnassius apollo]